MTTLSVTDQLLQAYETAYNETWKKFKIVPKHDGEYRAFEIPDDSKYIDKAVVPSEVKMYYMTITNPDGSTKKVTVFGDGPYSNWFPCEIKADGQTYYSSEQMFMYKKASSEYFTKPSKEIEDDAEQVIEHNEAIKAHNKDIADQIMKCRCPMELQKYGRQLKLDIDAWNLASSEILKTCIVEKFEQNPYLKAILDIAHDNKCSIIEGTKDQNYGCGVKFDPTNEEHLNPKNWTGKMLLTDIYKKAMDTIYKKAMNTI